MKRDELSEASDLAASFNDQRVMENRWAGARYYGKLPTLRGPNAPFLSAVDIGLTILCSHKVAKHHSTHKDIENPARVNQVMIVKKHLVKLGMATVAVVISAILIVLGNIFSEICAMTKQPAREAFVETPTEDCQDALRLGAMRQVNFVDGRIQRSREFCSHALKGFSQ